MSGQWETFGSPGGSSGGARERDSSFWEIPGALARPSPMEKLALGCVCVCGGGPPVSAEGPNAIFKFLSNVLILFLFEALDLPDAAKKTKKNV